MKEKTTRQVCTVTVTTITIIQHAFDTTPSEKNGGRNERGGGGRVALQVCCPRIIKECVGIVCENISI